jgi:hypothetical protein
MSVAVLACGDDEETKQEPAGNAGTVNEATVQQAATTAFQATEQAISTMDGQAAAFTMLSVGTSALSMITPGGGSAPMSTGTAQSALGEGTCDCTANSCNFSDCGDAAGFTITGTIAWTDTTLDCDYTVAGLQGGYNYSFSIFCDLDYTATSLDGTIETSGDYQIDAQGTMQSFSWDSSLTFNGVTYASGQPTGGSIDVTASVNLGGQIYNGSSSVSF